MAGEMDKAISFWSFIENNRLEIPIIQRDYAQGRVGKEPLRRDFLNYLKDALVNDTKAQLDFVYGAEVYGAITPLDGQQRLTTLWLLHWYLAYKSGQMDNKTKSILRNFSYETRDSSRDFCRDLSLFEKTQVKATVSEEIENQSWFSSYWKQDPTVQSMLRMLSGTKDEKGNPLGDGIEQVFSDCDWSKLWNKLTGKNCPITFYYLDLVGLGQSDELYLKMNARGEQLTDFENFKADLVDFLRDRNDLNDIENGIPIKLDRDWANLFWNGAYLDEAYMAFINRFFLNSIVVEKENGQFCHPSGGVFEESYKSHNDFFDYFYGRPPQSFIGKKEVDDSRIAYVGFSKFKFSGDTCLLETLDLLRKTLDGYRLFVEKTDLKRAGDFKLLTASSWGATFDFIPVYDGESTITSFKNEEIHKVVDITQNERVLFHAVCRFMARVEESDDPEVLKQILKQWMRVVWNLISDKRLRTITDMVNQLQIVEDLSEHSKNIYQHLNGLTETGSDILRERLSEEIAKALKIYENGTVDESWEKKFIENERHFNKGTIRFLFTGANGEEDWTNFDKKAQTLPWNDLTIMEKGNLKELVSHCETWDELKAIVYDYQDETWIKNLTNKDLYPAVHSFLLNGQRLFLNHDQVLSSVYEDLTNTDVLKHLKYYDSEITGCKLRDDKFGVVALFPDNAKSERKKFVLGNKRNQVLSTLVNQNKYQCDQQVEKTGLFWGWDVIFTNPSGQAFKWTVVLENNDWKPQLFALDDQKNKIPVINDATLQGELNNLKAMFGIAVPTAP